VTDIFTKTLDNNIFEGIISKLSMMYYHHTA